MAGVPMPTFLQRFYSLFPLHVYEGPLPFPTDAFSSLVEGTKDSEKTWDTLQEYPSDDMNASPILFIHKPTEPSKSLLSSDIECVKWQAFLALRTGSIRVSWDLAPEGALGGKLPNLYLPSPRRQEGTKQASHFNVTGELLESRRIASWINGEMGQRTQKERHRADWGEDRMLEGYKNAEARDESRAWITLLETDVDAVIRANVTQPSVLSKIISFPPPTYLERPLLARTYTGISSIISPFGSVVIMGPILERYKDAMEALSTCLGTSKWFLDSSQPTTLDAVAFAYVYSAAQHPQQEIRQEVNRWVNLVAWEKRIRENIEAVVHN
ncbi:hypothetical protein FRC17_005987 [Serendipita sp. 399]|nr:hypothetical protein FRC17_005987 [Serendipita sp. 399]